MSLLTPERVPVKVYRWDDVGAPTLDKAANCMIGIFKSCLVTGYGIKDSAGWTLPFDGLGVSVLRPADEPNADYYLRLSTDTGTQVTAQAYSSMVDANTGELSLQCATPFKYAKKNSSGKWLLVASSRGFWFFCDQSYKGLATNTGAYFFIGTLLGDYIDAIYLKHTGGTYDDGDYSGLLDEHDAKDGTRAQGKISVNGAVSTADPVSWANGFDSVAKVSAFTPVFIFVGDKAFQLTGCLVPLKGSTAAFNYDSLSIVGRGGGVNVIAHGSGGRANTPSRMTMSYVVTDYWVY